VVFTVGRGETVVEYTNVLFAPTLLKLCKVAASPSLVGQNFTFNIQVDSENGLVPVNAQNNTGPTFRDFSPNQVGNLVTIPAGELGASGQGNCVIVNGPYAAASGVMPAFGTFRVGSRVIVTELSSPGTGIITVTSPTGTPVVDLPNNRATLTLSFPGGFNELVVTNGLTTGLESDIGSRFTGDGLLLANDVVFLRLFAVGLLSTNPAFNEFQRADAAPRASLGDALITSGDVIQARRYVAGLDPPTPAGGPYGPVAPVTVSSLAAAQRTISAFTANGCAGFNSTVAIMLDSDGGEAGAGFTVTFDPAVLTSPVISLGKDTADGGFVLTTNMNSVASGHIGILLDAQDPFPGSPARRHLVNIHFQVVPGASTGQTQIGFSDKTTYLSTSDALGNLLSTSYQPSNISIGGTACTTSAGVALSGRVLSPDGIGLRNATVSVTDSGGNSRTVVTSSLGYYQIGDLLAGQSYIVGVSNKRYRFSSRVVQVSDSLTNLDFVGTE
jgi:hypothetical protein